STTAANEAIRPPAGALSRFVEALEAQAGPERGAGARPASIVSLFSRLRSAPAGIGWAVAAALIALVVVQQVTRPGGGTSDFEVAGADNSLAVAPFALVKFRPDARMADVMTTLSVNGLNVSSGPSAVVVFRIAFPATGAADYVPLL